jgi:hypothetical protein
MPPIRLPEVRTRADRPALRSARVVGSRFAQHAERRVDAHSRTGILCGASQSVTGGQGMSHGRDWRIRPRTALWLKLAALGRRQPTLSVLATLSWAYTQGCAKLVAGILGAWLTTPHGTGPSTTR